MTQHSEPVFLERQSYRRRRLMDAARMLPLLGAVLFVLPVLWADTDGGGGSTARGGLYLFAAWTLLVIGAALLARPLARSDAPLTGAGTGPGAGSGVDPR
ncbi:hypothetical protein LCGC14_2692180 [marine sediment metagenome]|uniref:Uncharacterized protein n=1 Tax=marine sediment metagenome TaxID=412755 RepID=A0A0F8ZIA9_9ZZZZ